MQSAAALSYGPVQFLTSPSAPQWHNSHHARCCTQATHQKSSSFSGLSARQRRMLARSPAGGSFVIFTQFCGCACVVCAHVCARVCAFSKQVCVHAASPALVRTCATCHPTHLQDGWRERGGRHAGHPQPEALLRARLRQRLTLPLQGGPAQARVCACVCVCMCVCVCVCVCMCV